MSLPRTYLDATVAAWIDARITTGFDARGGYTPLADLHRDYQAWARADRQPGEVILERVDFESALEEARLEPRTMLVHRSAEPTYEPCYPLALLDPIWAVA